jgi:hypothetical protein
MVLGKLRFDVARIDTSRLSWADLVEKVCEVQVKNPPRRPRRNGQSGCSSGGTGRRPGKFKAISQIKVGTENGRVSMIVAPRCSSWEKQSELGC